MEAPAPALPPVELAPVLLEPEGVDGDPPLEVLVLPVEPPLLVDDAPPLLEEELLFDDELLEDELLLEGELLEDELGVVGVGGLVWVVDDGQPVSTTQRLTMMIAVKDCVTVDCFIKLPQQGPQRRTGCLALVH